MNLRRPFTALALAGAVSVGALATGVGAAGALDNAPASNRSGVCDTVEARIRELVPLIHATTDAKRKAILNKELWDLGQFFGKYCVPAPVGGSKGGSRPML